MLFYGISILVIFIDQLAKYFVDKYMVYGQSVPVFNGFLQLTYVRNTGAAFSLFVGFSPYLIAVGVLAAIVVIFFHYRLPPEDIYLQMSMAFILGGSLGNLIDRVVRSFVVDYVDILIWPVFNFADVMINLGVILIAIKLFEKKESEVKDAPNPF